MKRIPIRPAVRETTKKIHFGNPWPFCSVTGLDNPGRGVIRSLRVTRKLEEVTCKSCLKLSGTMKGGKDAG